MIGVMLTGHQAAECKFRELSVEIFALARSSTDHGVEHGRVHVEMFDENTRQFVFDHQTIENRVPLNSELFTFF